MSGSAFTITGRNLSVQGYFTEEPGEIKVEGEDLSVNDGYHSLSELYDHRLELFAALLRTLRPNPYLLEGGPLPRGEGPGVWKSKHHSDCDLGETRESFLAHKCSMFEGWFVAGINILPGQQITYHLPLEMFDDLKIWELIKAPEYDGHTSEDVLQRLKLL